MTDAPSPPAPQPPAPPATASAPAATGGRTRWLLLAVGLVVAAVAFALVWGLPEIMQQFRVLISYVLGFLTLVGLAAWVALFSGWQGRTRLATLGVPVLVVVVILAAVRIDGVTGDFIPVVRWRWQARPGDAAPADAIAKAAARQAATSAKAAQPGDAPSGNPQAPLPAETPLPGLADFPQFFGPHRDGVVTSFRLQTDWEANPPKELWRRPVGAGWSGFAAMGRRAVTQEQHGPDEAVVCYDIANGDILWAHTDPARYDTTIGGVGPRATPTLHDGKVYTHGATGRFNCLDLETGAIIWAKDLQKDAYAKVNEWGNSGSPLIEGDLVIINAGGDSGQALVAYDRLTGERRWAAGEDNASYGSPMIATLAGVRHIVMLNNKSVTGHSIETGKVLWETPWGGHFPKVAQPMPVMPAARDPLDATPLGKIDTNLLLVSSGYGVGAALFKFTQADGGKLAFDRQWANLRLKAKFSNFVQHKAHVYGLNDGLMVCIEPVNGERLWRGSRDAFNRGRYGHGQMILIKPPAAGSSTTADVSDNTAKPPAKNQLLVQTESGQIILLDPSPEKLTEITQFQALTGKSWNPPALAGRYLLVRTVDQAACFEMPIAE